MNKEGELSNALYEAIKRVTRGGVIVDAVVLLVDETAFTCDVKTGDTTFFDVPLRVLVSSQASYVEIPETGTKCVICFRDANQGRPQILMVDKALKILVKCDNIVFNDGMLGGLVKVNEVVNDLNAIKQDINALKAVFSGWSPVPNDGGAALKSAAGSW